MSDKQIADDLAEEPDLSLLQHFHKPDQMGLLEELFCRTMGTFGLSKEELKTNSEFNFDAYGMTGFESVRAVFRLANALSEVGFTQFAFLRGTGLADLEAMENGHRWFIEVKTLVLQTKPPTFAAQGAEILRVDKFQPNTNRIEEYVETVSRQITGNLIEKARQQLIETLKKKGKAKRMVGLVVNLLAADFLDENLDQVHARLCGKFPGWEKNYLTDLDAVVFFTGRLHLFG